MTRLARAAWFALIFGSLLAPSARAQTTILAASCAQTDVAAAVAMATNGDTVVIPTCTSTTPGGINTWTTTLQVSVGIILEGQGIGNTVLIDGVSKGNSVCSGGGPLIAMAAGANNFRITGFTLLGDAPDTYVCNSGHITLNGTASAIRVDHINLMNQQTSGVRTGGCLYGVIDHNTFDLSENRRQGVVIFHDGCGGGSFGDYNWSVATALGGPDFLFIETNTFMEKPGVTPAGDIDNYGGGRFVFRYNNASFIAGHGTESSQYIRGLRAFEVYNNTFTAVEPAQFSGFFVRSGTGVVWANNFQDSGTNNYNGFVTLELFRDANYFPPWGPPPGSGNAGACDGTGPYDNNSGTVYDSGTVKTGGSRTFTDSSKSWTVNQWAGASYTIRDVTQGFGFLIKSNTANSITAPGDAGYGQPGNFVAGDSYQILSAYPCLDQPGVGQGTLLSGVIPTPTGWVKDASEPIYQWSNTHNSSASITISSASSRVLVNRDYYDNTQLPGYTPYPYPHPLVMSSPTGNPPTNAQGTPH